MNPTCTEVEPRLSAWIDDELEPRERERVAAHLQTCATCRGDEAGLRAAARALGTRFAALKAEAPPPVAAARNRLHWSRFAPLAAAAVLLVLWIVDGEREVYEPPAEAALALTRLLEAETLELVAETQDGVRVRSVSAREGSAFAWEERAGGFGGGGDADEVWLHVPNGGVARAARVDGAWLPEQVAGEWPSPLGPRSRGVLEELARAARLARESEPSLDILAPEGVAWITARVGPVRRSDAYFAELRLKRGGTWRITARAVTPPPDFHTPERVLRDPSSVRDAALPERGMPPWLRLREPTFDELEQLRGLGYMGED